MKDDVISRQAAATIPVMPKEHRHYQTNNLDDAYEQGWNDLQKCIENLPPVQLGTNLAEVGTDLVSKQAALDALTTYIYNVYKAMTGKRMPTDKCRQAAESVLDELPTVQPTQTSCEYCHTDRDGYVFPLDKNSHAFIDRDKIVLKANGWRGKAKIKYCPICGRRLTDG